MKVFIIGGSGLISTAVRAECLAQGHEVVLFNRGLSPLRGPRPARLIQGDRNDEAALRAALRAERPDAVLDMVAFGPGQAEALLRAADGQSPQLLVCSTVCVYGGPLTRLPADEDEPQRPVTALLAATRARWSGASWTVPAAASTAPSSAPATPRAKARRPAGCSLTTAPWTACGGACPWW